MCGARVKPPIAVAEVGDHVEDAAGDGDEEDAHDREAEREQAQVEDDEALGCSAPACGGTLTGWAARLIAWPPRIPRVIDREQVLHVARLARLRLDEAEVERMAGELSGILEHVDRIAELDLDGVEPTSHVVELENVLRRRRAAAELASRAAFSSRRPIRSTGAFRVPSPQAEADGASCWS